MYANGSNIFSFFFLRKENPIIIEKSSGTVQSTRRYAHTPGIIFCYSRFLPFRTVRVNLYAPSFLWSLKKNLSKDWKKPVFIQHTTACMHRIFLHWIGSALNHQRKPSTPVLVTVPVLICAFCADWRRLFFAIKNVISARFAYSTRSLVYTFVNDRFDYCIRDGRSDSAYFCALFVF